MPNYAGILFLAFVICMLAVAAFASHVSAKISRYKGVGNLILTLIIFAVFGVLTLSVPFALREMPPLPARGAKSWTGTITLNANSGKFWKSETFLLLFWTAGCGMYLLSGLNNWRAPENELG